jgi:hypothetical protein
MQVRKQPVSCNTRFNGRGTTSGVCKHRCKRDGMGKNDAIESFAKASIKSQPAMKRPQPFLDLFLTLWLGDWREQLQQLNSVIERDYKNKSKHKHSVRKIKVVNAN